MEGSVKYSDKASEEDVENGTNDEKYVTPKSLKPISNVVTDPDSGKPFQFEKVPYYFPGLRIENIENFNRGYTAYVTNDTFLFPMSPLGGTTSKCYGAHYFSDGTIRGSVVTVWDVTYSSECGLRFSNILVEPTITQTFAFAIANGNTVGHRFVDLSTLAQYVVNNSMYISDGNAFESQTKYGFVAINYNKLVVLLANKKATSLEQVPLGDDNYSYCSLVACYNDELIITANRYSTYLVDEVWVVNVTTKSITRSSLVGIGSFTDVLRWTYDKNANTYFAVGKNKLYKYNPVAKTFSMNALSLKYSLDSGYTYIGNWNEYKLFLGGDSLRYELAFIKDGETTISKSLLVYANVSLDRVFQNNCIDIKVPGYENYILIDNRVLLNVKNGILYPILENPAIRISSSGDLRVDDAGVRSSLQGGVIRTVSTNKVLCFNVNSRLSTTNGLTLSVLGHESYSFISCKN